MRQELEHKLQLLEKLIHQERHCACALKVDELKGIQEEKGLLVKEIQELNGNFSAEQKQIAGRLREENRRNAQLLYTCLNYLRQAMRQCTQQLTPVSYGRYGNSLQTAPSGLLLTGRI